MNEKWLLENELSEEEQFELYERLAYKYSRAASVGEPNMGEQEVWDALHEALAIHKTKFATFVLTFGRSKYREACEVVSEIIQDGSGEVLRVGRRRAILVMAFQCLEGVLRSRGIPVTPATMLKNCERLKYALDQNFPGYCQAKLLHKIVQLAAA